MTDLEGTVIMEPINHKIFLSLSLAGHLRRFSLSLSLALASLFDFLWDHQKEKVRQIGHFRRSAFDTCC